MIALCWVLSFVLWWLLESSSLIQREEAVLFKPILQSHYVTYLPIKMYLILGSLRCSHIDMYIVNTEGSFQDANFHSICQLSDLGFLCDIVCWVQNATFMLLRDYWKTMSPRIQGHWKKWMTSFRPARHPQWLSHPSFNVIFIFVLTATRLVA